MCTKDNTSACLCSPIKVVFWSLWKRWPALWQWAVSARKTQKHCGEVERESRVCKTYCGSSVSFNKSSGCHTSNWLLFICTGRTERSQSDCMNTLWVYIGRSGDGVYKHRSGQPCLLNIGHVFTASTCALVSRGWLMLAGSIHWAITKNYYLSISQPVLWTPV